MSLKCANFLFTDAFGVKTPNAFFCSPTCIVSCTYNLKILSTFLRFLQRVPGRLARCQFSGIGGSRKNSRTVGESGYPPRRPLIFIFHIVCSSCARRLLWSQRLSFNIIIFIWKFATRSADRAPTPSREKLSVSFQ